MRAQFLTTIAFLGILLAGCGSKAPAPYPDWLANLPTESNPNGFEAYEKLAGRAQSIAPQAVNRVSFTPGERAKLREQLAPVLSDLERANRGQAVMPVRLPRQIEDSRRQYAWMLVGRVLAWTIEDACSKQDWDRAVRWALAAHKFGVRLTGGGATESSLGWAIIEQSRRAIAPSLRQMPAASLTRLATGLSDILAKAPDRSLAMEHEGRHMLVAVQMVQEARQNRKYDHLRGPGMDDLREAVDYLERMPESERPKYFQGFADEAVATAQFFRQAAESPASHRSDITFPENAYRPWKRFSKHLFGNSFPALQIADLGLTRTRLLAATAYLTAQAKAGKPVTVGRGLTLDIWIDPYSGEPFPSQVSGRDFSIYSVGSDGRDDGGDTDETNVSPDIRLEDGRH